MKEGLAYSASSFGVLRRGVAQLSTSPDVLAPISFQVWRLSGMTFASAVRCENTGSLLDAFPFSKGSIHVDSVVEVSEVDIVSRVVQFDSTPSPSGKNHEAFCVAALTCVACGLLSRDILILVCSGSIQARAQVSWNEESENWSYSTSWWT